MVRPRRLDRLWRRLLLRLLPALLVAAGVAQGALVPSIAQASTAHPNAKASPALSTQSPPSATSVDVLLLHGLEGFNTANCNTATTTDSSGNHQNTFDRWGGFFQVNGTGFAGISWPRNLLHTLGYFTGDYSCDQYLGTESTYTACQGYYSGNEQTNNEDIRHIACRFYWFVYNNYTSQGKYVHILAHSMGGIIAKWALSEAGHDSHFPYPLLVYNVVTLSTPFQGIPTNFLGWFNHAAAGIACSNCFDALQLENGGTDSIIGALNAFTSTEGYWTVIGSSGNVPAGTQFFSLWLDLVNVTFPTCDVVNVGSTLAVDNSVITPGQSLASAQVINYDQCIFHEEDYPGAYTPWSTSYQDDASTYKDYSGWVGTPGNTSYTYRTLPHALAKALEALGVTRGPNMYPYLSQMPYTYAANNGDGRLELFARGSDHNIWHIWQTCPNCGWSSWSPLQSGYSFNGDPAVGQDGDGRLEVFARGTNNAILVDAQTLSGKVVTGWSGWHTLSQAYGFQGTPMAVRNTNNSLEVFAHGGDGNIWHNWESSAGSTTWNGWVPLQSGYGFKGDPVVGMNSDGRVEVFALGNDGNIWHNWQLAPHSSWSGWNSLQSGQSFLGRVSVGRNLDGRLEVYALDWNNNVVHDYELVGGGWSGWGALQSQTAHIFNSTPAVGNNADGRLEVFATDNAYAEIYHNWQTTPNGGWNGWANLQSGYGFVGAAPATAQIYDGRLEVFAVGRDNNIWHNFVLSGGGWSGWQTFQSGYSFAPSDCVNTPSDQMCDNGFYTNEDCPDSQQLETVTDPYLSITIHYSTSCQTNWTSVQWLGGTSYQLYQVDIERQGNTSDGALTYTEVVPSGVQSWYTNMLWSPNNPARSCAWYVQPPYARIYGPVCTGWH